MTWSLWELGHVYAAQEHCSPNSEQTTCRTAENKQFRWDDGGGQAFELAGGEPATASTMSTSTEEGDYRLSSSASVRSGRPTDPFEYACHSVS